MKQGRQLPALAYFDSAYFDSAYFDFSFTPGKPPNGVNGSKPNT
jgi:hypothetical protein